MTHPIRQAEVHVFERCDPLPNGHRFHAKFYPYKDYPAYFLGDTYEEALKAAEAFRADAIANHEALVISRKEAAAKRKAKLEVQQ